MNGGTLEERAWYPTNKLIVAIVRILVPEDRLRTQEAMEAASAVIEKGLADFARTELEPIVKAAEKLLEWMPTCSKGSSGYIRQENLRAAIRAYAERK